MGQICRVFGCQIQNMVVGKQFWAMYGKTNIFSTGEELSQIQFHVLIAQVELNKVQVGFVFQLTVVVVTNWNTERTVKVIIFGFNRHIV
ncbi:hypothetical protein D3C78_1516050 [compost metagenome]